MATARNSPKRRWQFNVRTSRGQFTLRTPLAVTTGLALLIASITGAFGEGVQGIVLGVLLATVPLLILALFIAMPFLIFYLIRASYRNIRLRRGYRIRKHVLE